MARLPRFFVPGEALHVIQRGNNREPVFAAETDHRFFLDCLLEATQRHGVLVHAYVLMTNHVHLLATPQRQQSMSKVLQSVGRRYVQYFNSAYLRTGTLWEGRYRATIVDGEQYLLTCMRYIELNPVRAGMVGHPAAYRWSSYRGNAEGVADALVRPHELYDRLGPSAPERLLAYRRLFHSALSQSDLGAIRDATNRNWALGSDRFRQRIEELSGRRSAPERRGRKARTDQPGNRV
jgi:putative transposase